MAKHLTPGVACETGFVAVFFFTPDASFNATRFRNDPLCPGHYWNLFVSSRLAFAFGPNLDKLAVRLQASTAPRLGIVRVSLWAVCIVVAFLDDRPKPFIPAERRHTNDQSTKNTSPQCLEHPRPQNQRATAKTYRSSLILSTSFDWLNVRFRSSYLWPGSAFSLFSFLFFLLYFTLL